MPLQPGIHFAPKDRPPPCFRLVTLDVAREAGPAAARGALEAVHAMLGALAGGHVRDLDGVESAEQFEGLRHLLGYGRRFFDGELTDAPRPAHLAVPGGGRALPGAALGRGGRR